MKETNLKTEVEQLIAEVDKTHRYSMSRIYDLYNRVFEKSETPQSCASCLIRKVRELRNWLESQTAGAMEETVITQTQTRKKKIK